MNATPLAGVFVVLPTPLTADEAIDHRGLRHLVDHYVDAGCHGLVVLGSGGESPYFGFAERVAIARTAIARARDRVPVVVGSAFTSVAEAVRFFADVDPYGPSAYLTALPTYYPVSNAEAVRAYRRLAAATATPLIYYAFPQVVGLAPNAGALAAILRTDNVVGIKESGLNLGDIRDHRRAVSYKEFASFVGTSFLLCEGVAAGCRGTICPVPSLMPHGVVACYEAAIGGDGDHAARLQRGIRSLLPLMSPSALPLRAQSLLLDAISRAPISIAVGRAPRHAVIKETLRRLGHPIGATVRAPLPPLDDADRATIERVLPFLRSASESRNVAPPLHEVRP